MASMYDIDRPLCRAPDKENPAALPALPQHARLPINRCNLPAVGRCDAGRVCAATAADVQRALQELMSHPELARLGANARRLAVERYAWDGVVAQLETLYREALTAPRPRQP